MKKPLPLRLGMMKVPGMFDVKKDENGIIRIQSIPVGIRHIQLYRDFGFNLTFEAVNEMSLGQRTANGTYSGLFSLIDKNEVDTVALPAETFILNPPGDFGPVIGGFSNVILSRLMPPEVVQLDVVSSANAFDMKTYFTLAIHLTLWFLLMKIVNKRYSLWSLFATLMSHHHIRYLLSSKRLLQFVVVILFLFLEWAILSNFSTDLTMHKPEDLIETLEDLAESPRQPWFTKMDNLYVQFMDSDNPKYANVWRKVEKCGINNCMMDAGGDRLTKLYSTNKGGDIAFVFSDVFIPIFTNYCCNLAGTKYQEDREKGYSMHISKPFSTVNYATLINRNAGIDQRSRLVELSYFQIEKGYSIKGLRDSNQLVEPVYGIFCPQTIFQKVQPPTFYAPLNVDGYKRMVTALVMSWAFGAIILIFEEFAYFVHQ